MAADRADGKQPGRHWPTAIPSIDRMGLGRTPGQRGAEILAGLRAELMPSPETEALAKTGGRVAAWIFMRLEKSTAALNFVAARLAGITELVRRAVPPEKEDVILVDIAAGFSPRGLMLAQAFPQARVIEVDLPGVVEEKQVRLRKAKELVVPPNLSWLAADLGVTALSDVLEDQRVDVVSAEGLNAYFPPEDITRVAHHIGYSLVPGGAYISDIPWQKGMAHAQTATRFFSRQAGDFRGIIEGPEQARTLMEEAGYSDIEVYHPSALAGQVGSPTPVLDFSLFIVAHKPKTEV